MFCPLTGQTNFAVSHFYVEVLFYSCQKLPLKLGWPYIIIIKNFNHNYNMTFKTFLFQESYIISTSCCIVTDTKNGFTASKTRIESA